MPGLPSPDAPLDALVTPRRLEAGRYEVVVPEGWQQGRGAFGGLVVAYVARALEAHVAAPDRSLRSLTAELCGPASPGPAELRLETLRAGSNVTTVAARLVQGGEVQAHAVGVLGRARAGGRAAVALSPPGVRPWRELEPLSIEPPMGPAFARFWEFRSEGPFPLSGEKDASARGWIRPRHPGAARDAAYLAACIDAWWPALLAGEAALRPVATVAFTLEAVGDFAGLDPAAPLLYGARDVTQRDGYAVEFRELWGEDGRLLALNQQTIAIIK